MKKRCHIHIYTFIFYKPEFSLLYLNKNKVFNVNVKEGKIYKPNLLYSH